MSLSDWYVGETKAFYGTITFNGTSPDISSDTVKLILKSNKSDLDSQAVLDTNSSMAASGSLGIYYFDINPSETADVTPSSYFYELIWNTSSGNEYILEQSQINLKSRVEDV